DKINLTNVLIKNIPADSRFGRLGRAVISGYVAMNGFEIGELDIALNAERLLVMSDATMVTMPDLYGDFIISTDNQPLRFYGTLDKPNLTGDVNIIDAHLKMPLEQKKQIVRTYFTYEKIDDKVRLTSITSRDSTEQNNNNDRFSPSIADLINYDLSAKILGQFIVEMDMNLIGSMYAVIATADRTQSLRYEKKRDNPVAKLFGEVVVKEQSTIKSWKQFTAAGKINFPTGSIENPSLELTATHSGTMTDNGVRKQFIVKMKIEGTKENPDVTFTYFIDGVEASGSKEQINEDALYLLVMGRTKTGSGASTNSNLLNEGFASGVSNFATKALSDLLMGTGVINSAEFDFQGGSMNLGDATLRLSGQLYGGISWTIGGTVADLSSNNQITIDIPASEFSNNPFWSNFILQLSKASSNNVMANAQDAKNWEVKIKLGSSW
ncbi:MAG: translocation/assembly module TamB domain-containing protein, partial [Candidatus Kapabacteria bacterium]|nr:translocation/assembly module TamB domain-containing protein [Candidatus Kapabacteria bacterium]